MKNLSIASTEIRQFDGLYSLNDLHIASGNRSKNRPTFFIKNDQTQALISEIDQCENSHSDKKSHSAIKVNNGGEMRGTFGCREIVLAYAMWISPAFMLKVIRAYDVMHNNGPLTITTEQQEVIQKAVNELSLHTGEDYRTIYNRLFDKFNIKRASFTELLAKDFDRAIEYLKPNQRRPYSSYSEDEAIKINTKALCSHMIWVYAWWRKYGDAIYALNPKMGSSIIDHFKDGAGVAFDISRRMGLERLQIPLDYPWEGNHYEKMRFLEVRHG